MTALFTAGVWTGLSGARQGVDSAVTVSLTARLDAAQEVPKPRARVGAHGSFAGGLVRSGAGGTLSWRLTFQGLSGSAAPPPPPPATTSTTTDTGTTTYNPYP